MICRDFRVAILSSARLLSRLERVSSLFSFAGRRRECKFSKSGPWCRPFSRLFELALTRPDSSNCALHFLSDRRNSYSGIEECLQLFVIRASPGAAGWSRTGHFPFAFCPSSTNRQHAGGLSFGRCSTLRNETLRIPNRPRTAVTVRLSLSAIIVIVFPASTISRRCLSSSGSHGRLPYFLGRII